MIQSEELPPTNYNKSALFDSRRVQTQWWSELIFQYLLDSGNISALKLNDNYNNGYNGLMWFYTNCVFMSIPEWVNWNNQFESFPGEWKSK